MNVLHQKLGRGNLLLIGSLMGSWCVGSFLGSTIAHFVTAHEWMWPSSIFEFMMIASGMMFCFITPGPGILAVVAIGSSLLLRRRLWLALAVGVLGMSCAVYWTAMIWYVH